MANNTKVLSRMFGFGFYITKGPSIADPAYLFRYTISLHFGIWVWHKSWYRGVGGR